MANALKYPYEIYHQADDIVIHFSTEHEHGVDSVKDIKIEILILGEVIDWTDHLKAHQPLRLEKYKQMAIEHYKSFLDARRLEPDNWRPDPAA